MDFLKILYEISLALAIEDVKALCFLCTDLVCENLSQVDEATNLFNILKRHRLLTEERRQLLTELLEIISRPLLIQKYQLPQSSNMISAYRKLLYNLNLSITDNHLSDIKFLLQEKLPCKKLKTATTLQVFLEMENAALLSRTDFQELESIFKEMYPALNIEIADYKAAPVRKPVAEEGGDKDKVQGSRMFCPGGPCLDGPPGTGDVESMCEKLEPLGIEEESSGDSTRVHEEMEKSHPPHSQVQGQYLMKSAKRGTCLIINNENFLRLKQRKGTLLDESWASAVFQWLNFEVKIHHDINSEGILSLIKETAAADHSQVDCLVCMIFSHGCEGSVFGVDDQPVKLEELSAPFNGSRCQSLAGKPKMFFIQACQGDKNNDAVTIESDSSVISDAGNAQTIPSVADYLLGMSTVPNFCSYREWTYGSWYIQSLCQHLIKRVPEGIDLNSVLTEVNNDVSLKSNHPRKKQMPIFHTSLRKKVVFPIPEAPPPGLPADNS